MLVPSTTTRVVWHISADDTNVIVRPAAVLFNGFFHVLVNPECCKVRGLEIAFIAFVLAGSVKQAEGSGSIDDPRRMCGHSCRAFDRSAREGQLEDLTVRIVKIYLCVAKIGCFLSK